MKAYTFRVFNKAVRRARASACPDDCDVDDDRREAFLVETHAFPLSPDRRRGCACSTTRGRARRRYVADGREPSARCYTRLETFTTTHHPRNRAHLTRRLPPSALPSLPDRDAVE
jgi:hypothetical protein